MVWLAFALIAAICPRVDAQAEPGTAPVEAPDEAETDAEESDAEESDAEESDAQENDAEESDADNNEGDVEGDNEAESSGPPAPTLNPAPTLSPAPTPPPCLSAPVTIQRAHSHPLESIALRLTHCDGSPNLAALRPLSTLGRAARTQRAAARLHGGLLTRLQAIANQFPGRAIAIVSGHRPRARRTSRHRHGRALDIRVEGVHRRDVSEFARGLADTGVGYYPNSTFTHVDVRGRAQYWVDRSAPGQRPDYGPWPPSRDVTNQVREAIAAATTRAFGGPSSSPASTTAPATAPATAPHAAASASAPDANAALVVPEASDESRPPGDVRDDAFAALEALRALDLRTP